MDQWGKTKKQKVNPLEAIRDANRNSLGVINEELVKPLPKDIAKQLFGLTPRSFSGEINPGESLEMKEVFTGEREKNEETQKKLALERRLREEEKVLVERKTNELRIQIRAIHEEIIKLAEVTPNLSQEIQVAALAAPVAPSEYELNFLQHILEFIRSFRKKIEKASIWMASANRRAAKKNVWGAHYKKHGAKYLLSGEHYLTRSAG